MSSEVYLWADPLSNNPLVSAVYHTTICVKFNNGLKYLFSYNDRGLNLSPACNRSPNRSHFLGRTGKTLGEATQHAYHLQSTTYRTYNPMTTNCNHFCNDLSLWLCGEMIPAEYIIQSLTVATNPVKLIGCIGGSSGSSS